MGWEVSTVAYEYFEPSEIIFFVNKATVHAPPPVQSLHELEGATFILFFNDDLVINNQFRNPAQR